MGIKLKTTAKHRFNRSFIIGDTSFQVSPIGEVEVDEQYVAKALEVGFELLDKNQKFKSEEDYKVIEEVNNTLQSAKTQATAIIEQAKKDADKIIQEANTKADLILRGNKVDAFEEMRKKLGNYKMEELKETLIASGVDVDSIKDLKKAELIDKIIELQQ